MEMDREWFQNALNDKSNKHIYFGIDEIESGKFIGIIQLNNIDYISGTAVLGFIIGDREKQGKGIGTEFSKLILDYSFNQLNIRKIISYVVEYNIISLNLFEKLGFIKEGTLRKQFYTDNEYKDVVIMALFKDDYLNVMGISSKYYFSDFTLDNYKRILSIASRNYSFRFLMKNS